MVPILASVYFCIRFCLTIRSVFGKEEKGGQLKDEGTFSIMGMAGFGCLWDLGLGLVQGLLYMKISVVEKIKTVIYTLNVILIYCHVRNL